MSYDIYIGEGAGRALTCTSNPYSGKWNHHYFTDRLEDALSSLERALRCVQ